MTLAYTAHPTAIIDEGARIGEGSRVWHWVHVCAGARIGAGCSLGQNVFYGQYTVRIVDPDALKAALAEQGIPTAVHYPLTLPRQPTVGQPEAPVPKAEKAAPEVLSLPMPPWLSAADQDRVIAAVRAWAEARGGKD